MPPLTGSTGGRASWDAKEKAPSNELLGALQYGGRCRNRTGVHGFAIRCITTLPTGLKTKAPHDFCGAILQTGAGNESCTRALSLCFPINFSAVVSSEGLNSSLVFFPRQQSSSTNFHQRPRTAIPFSRHGRRTRRYQRPTTAAPLAQPGLLASEMATASRVETALGWMPCGPQLKVARGEGHAASEERWGRMFTSPGRLTTESERRTTASN